MWVSLFSSAQVLTAMAASYGQLPQYHDPPGRFTAECNLLGASLWSIPVIPQAAWGELFPTHCDHWMPHTQMKSRISALRGFGHFLGCLCQSYQQWLEPASVTFVFFRVLFAFLLHSFLLHRLCWNYCVVSVSSLDSTWYNKIFRTGNSDSQLTCNTKYTQDWWVIIRGGIWNHSFPRYVL